MRDNAPFLTACAVITALLFAGCGDVEEEVDPIAVANYRCEARGGVQGTSTSRSGTVTAVTCKDGTVHGTIEWTSNGTLDELKKREAKHA